MAKMGTLTKQVFIIFTAIPAAHTIPMATKQFELAHMVTAAQQNDLGGKRFLVAEANDILGDSWGYQGSTPSMPQIKIEPSLPTETTWR